MELPLLPSPNTEDRIPKRSSVRVYVGAIALFCVLLSTVVVLLFKERVVRAAEVSDEIIEEQDISLPDRKDVLTFGPRPEMSSESYFDEIRNSLIKDGVSFIDADLTDMSIRFYEHGTVAFTVPIQTKGRPGSWWQTPAGVYKIESKEEKHYSTFGHVYTNWNLPFQGNFFIHGWPYYENGDPVARGYSGGCIRLHDEDAKRLYEVVNAGTPIIVHEKNFESDGFSYTPPTPDVSAREYLVVDLKSGNIIFEKNEIKTVPIASITKLMTALIATEYLNLDKNISVTEKMVVPTSKPRLRVGDTILAFHLLYPLLIESSNEASVALASVLGEEKFVELMNTKAESLGMRDSRFVDASGAGAGNISSSKDLARLAQYLYFNRPFILALTAGKLNSGAYQKPYFKDYVNMNVFFEDTTFAGGKIGKTTEAGETMVAVFDSEVYGSSRPIAYIVLGAEDVKSDIDALHTSVARYYGMGAK